MDSAYAVHTDIGNHCAACEINRQPAPLSTALQNGQTVRIITKPTARPNPSWLDHVVSSRARSHIRHFLKHQRQEAAVKLGKRLLRQALRGLGGDLRPWKKGAELPGHLSDHSLDQLHLEIGLGQRNALLTARSLLGSRQQNHKKAQSEERPLVIHGTEGENVRLAECCRPIPGDSITGHFSRNRGLVVHRERCPSSIRAVQADPDNHLVLAWAEELNQEFPVAIRVEVANRRGTLSLLATTIFEQGAQIEKIHTEDRDQRHGTVHLTLGVRDRIHLARIMRKLHRLPPVFHIAR